MSHTVLENQLSGPVLGPQLTNNKLRRNVLTWSARVTKSRTSAMAYPHEDTAKDQAQADAANAILDSQRQVQDRDALLALAGFDVCNHTTVGFGYLAPNFDVNIGYDAADAGDTLAASLLFRF
jgi:hypothetical protein